jgi:hypothetical protein
MAGDKFLYNNAGVITEKVSNQASAGAGDAGKIVALDSTGRVDSSMMPVGIGADTQAITTSEALAAGDLVNIWNSTGVKARKADASVSGKEAMGFVLAAASSGASATVYFEGTNTQVTGQTPGLVFLSATTPGLATATAPSGTGQVVQRVGYATGTTSLNFNASPPIVLA